MMEKRKRNFPLLVAALSVNCLSLAMGCAYAWTSPVLPKINGQIDPENNPFDRPITPFEESWVGSLLSLGAVVGPLAGGTVVDKFGRKKILITLSIPVIISYVILAFATSVEYYYFARFLQGLGIGCVFSIAPMYIGEIAEDTNRGALGCIMGAMATLGTLSCFSIGPYVSIKLLSLLSIVPLIVFLITFSIHAPESPYYLILVNKKTEASTALKRLRTGDIEKELEEITKSVEDSMSHQATIKDFFKSKAITKSLLIGTGLVFFQQFSGNSVVICYMQSIFQAAGSSILPDVASIIVAFVQLVINVITSQLIEKVGRRILVLSSLIGAFVAHISLGVYFYLKDDGFDVAGISWLPIASLIVYIIFFNIGLGPVTWAMMGELFPPHFKSIATTITTMVCLLSSFTLMVFYPNLSVIIGMAKSFWLFAFFCGLGIIFAALIVPETKGKSLIEIQNMLGENKKV